MTINSNTPIVALSRETGTVYAKGELVGETGHFYGSLLIEESFRAPHVPKHGEINVHADTARAVLDKLTEEITPFFNEEILVEEDTSGQPEYVIKGR